MAKQTPLLKIKPADRRSAWVKIDMRERAGHLDIVAVIPMFGPDHRAGTDCWCHPEEPEPGYVIHREAH